VAIGGERLVLARPGASEDGVDHDLAAVARHAGSVSAEHAGKVAGAHADPSQRPQLVVVERGRAHLDDLPAGRRVGLRVLAHDEAGERVVGVGRRGGHREHRGRLARRRTRRGTAAPGARD
jgi:hypothetical protein